MNIRHGLVAIGIARTLLACTVYDPSLLSRPGDGVTGADDNPGTGAGVDAAPGPTGVGGASSSGSSATNGVTVTVGTTGAAGQGGNTGTGGADGGTTTGTGGAPPEIDGGTGSMESGAIDAGSPSMEAGPPPTSDAGCARCPVGITLASEVRTSLEGGASGNVHLDRCPEGQVVIGYQGYTETESGPTVGRIQTLCGQVAIVPSSSGYRATITAAAVLPMRATHGQVAWTNETCPSDQAVVGMHGLQQGAGDSVNQLAFECAPLTVATSGSGYAISIARSTTLPANGGPGGTAFTDGCGAGRVARGSEIHAASWVDAFALFCATPVAVGADGNPL